MDKKLNRQIILTLIENAHNSVSSAMDLLRDEVPDGVIEDLEDEDLEMAMDQCAELLDEIEGKLKP